MDQRSSDSLDFEQLVASLGGKEVLAASARAHGAFLRAREVKSASDLLRLVLLYGPSGLSLRAAAAMAAQADISDISDVALLNRIRGSANWLEALCVALLNQAAAPTSLPAASETASRTVRLIDASIIKAPGKAGNYRLHLRWDAGSQRITAAKFTTTKTGERLDLLPPEPGSLVIADRGYPQPKGLRNVLAAGSDVLVRITWNSLCLTSPDGQSLDWPALCAKARKGGLDMPVMVHKSRGRFDPLPMRLVMIPKPPELTEQARGKAKRKSAKGRRKTIDPRTLACADYLIVLTSLPNTITADQILVLYRLRWQIELVFKRLKSLLHIDRLAARDPDLVKAWLHAHLLVALIAEHHIAPCDACPPEPDAKPRPSLWRRCILAFTSIIQAIVPRLPIVSLPNLFNRTRQLNEPPRSRSLQARPIPLS